MSLRTLEENGQKFAVIPLGTYEALLNDAEDKSDIGTLLNAQARNEEQLPLQFCNELEDALRAGKPVIGLWRKYRKLTQAQLADLAGVKQGYISQIESGGNASFDVMKALAEALNITLDDLV